MCVVINAECSDLQEISQLHVYQSEAELFGSRDIPPLKQTLDEVLEEFRSGIILKMVDDKNAIIGSVRAQERDGTVYIGKLMVHPEHRHKGYGTMLLSEIEKCFPDKRYELFTSTRSLDNIRLYQKLGYTEAKRNDEFVYYYKHRTEERESRN